MIILEADERQATARVVGRLTTGSVGIPVEVDLSHDFNGLQCIVCFRTDYASADVPYDGTPITVPPQCLATAGVTLMVGVYGARADGTVVIPTVWASAGTVKQGTVPSGVEPAAPAPSWVAKVQEMASTALDVATGGGGRVESLDGTTLLVVGRAVAAVGIPAYVADPTAAEYAAYNLTEPGWYVLARIAAPDGTTVSSSTTVEGAAGSIVTTGADHVDVAVRFEVAAQSVPVTISWGEGTTETYVFRAGDLAVRNLDYRTTFYVYDITDYATWEYALTTDTTFAEGRHYYVSDGDGGYELAPVDSYTVGDPLPADTYYVHSKVTFEGMVRNVTYQCGTPIDCPSEFVLPEVEDETHGCWFEIRFLHEGSYSSTLVPPSPSVKVATERTQAETKGINMVDLHYTSVGGAKVWRFMNTHSTFTPAASPLASIAFRTPPARTSYAVGEALDTTGAVVVATYEDGHSKIVTPTYAPADGAALAAGDTELTATYTEGEVTVSATTPLTITGGE